MSITNLVGFVISACICIGEMKVIESLAHYNVISSETSRKLIHILTGPIYLVCWRLFDDSYYARYFAVLVPLAATLKVAFVALGILNDKQTVQSMSRTGKREELLKGPFSYGLIFIISTILFWRNHVSSVISLMLLCAGDGFAGLIGYKYGRMRIPYNRSKTVEGTIAFIISSLVSIMAILTLYAEWQWIQVDWSVYFIRLFTIVIISAFTESLPLGEWDNVIVFVVSLGLNYVIGSTI